MIAAMTTTLMAPTDQTGGLNDTWRVFLAECQQTFPSDLTQPTDITSLQQQLKEQVRGEDEHGRRSVEYLLRSLTCVAKASEVVAQAAAVAFSPAQICGNAIVLVVNSVKKIRGAFADLSKLTERMVAFLDVLKVHIEQKTNEHALPELCNACDRVLRQYLSILRLIYALSNSKRERIKAAFKIFTDDNEVQDNLDKLETTIRDFTQMEVALILSNVSDSARDLLQVRQDVHALVDSNTLAVIEKALSLHGFGKVDEQNRYYHVRLCNSAIPGTGQWLVSSDRFQAWVNGGPDPVLCLVGGRGSGKTMLMNRIVCHLQEIKTANVKVSYFYNGSTTNLSTLSWALRCMIWQICKSDAHYAKVIEGALGRADINTPLSLWQNLLLEPLQQQSSTYLLVLDGLFGVDQRAADVLARIINDITRKDGTAIRLLMAGQPRSTYYPINRALRASKQHRLSVLRFAERDERRNAEDIELLVKHNLNDSIWTPDDQDLVAQTMIRTLNSNNLFDELLSSVRQLNKCLGRDSLGPKLDELETNSREARIAAVGDRIARMHKELGPDQINELNTALPWVIVCGGSCEIALLDEVLRLRHSEPSKRMKRSIVDRLDLYHHLLAPTSRRKKVKFWANIDVFGHMERQRIVQKKSPPQSSRGKVPQQEVEVMRTFLKTFCKSAMYDKFGFDEFFDAKLGVANRRGFQHSDIVLDKTLSELAVLKTCLDALIKQRTGGGCRRIHIFARENLANLLRSEVLDNISPDEQVEVTAMLFSYISNPCMPNVWCLDDPDRAIDLSTLCRAMQQWLCHSAAKAVVEESDCRALMEEFRDSKEPESILLRVNAGNASDQIDRDMEDSESSVDGSSED